MALSSAPCVKRSVISVAIMVDYNQSLTPSEAVQRLRALDDEGLTWVEEPTLAHDYAGHALIARAAKTPNVTVSLKLTAICIVDRTGKIEREGVVSSDPEAIAIFIKSHAPHVARVGLETGATATWLWTELNKLGLPVICIDARHAKAALKMQINKSDRNDAVGIARIMQCGWYKEVHVKDLDSHAVKALLASRALLVKIKRDLENQIRGLLKNLGLVIGRAKMNVFAVRAAELTENRPELAAAVVPLLSARAAIEQQIADLHRKVMRLARNNAQARRFMTAPGVGPITALCFLATIDDPTRFKRSRSVDARESKTRFTH